MRKDYAKEAEARDRKRRGKSNRSKPVWWQWLFPLLLLIGVAYGFFYLKKHDKTPAISIDTQESSKKNQKAEQAKSASTEENKPRFEFYSMLPKMEINVDDTNSNVTSTTAPPVDSETNAANKPAANTIDQGNSYHLQIAVLRNRAEAENLVQRFSSFNLNMYIESIKSGSQTWYRVQAGPFTSLKKATEAQAIMRQSGVESLLKQG